MKSCIYYEHDFSQFDKLKFINDFDTMHWSNVHDDKTDLDKNLMIFMLKFFLVWNRMLHSTEVKA